MTTLQSENTRRDSFITPTQIKEIVCEVFGVTAAEMDSDGRSNRIAFARMSAMVFVHEFCFAKPADIGPMFRRDSTIFYNARGSISDLYDTDRRFRRTYDAAKMRILEITSLNNP